MCTLNGPTNERATIKQTSDYHIPLYYTYTSPQYSKPTFQEKQGCIKFLIPPERGKQYKTSWEENKDLKNGDGKENKVV